MPFKELTFTDLNDNIDAKFLETMCTKFGELAECRIYYHPRTRKHLGLAKVTFHSEKAARDCQHALHNTMKMGNRISVFLDTQGVERAKLVEALCSGSSSDIAAATAAAAAAAAKIHASTALPTGATATASPSKLLPATSAATAVSSGAGEMSPLQNRLLLQSSKPRNIFYLKFLSFLTCFIRLI